MREHDEDYLAGAGHAQERYEVDVPDFATKFSAHGAIIKGSGDYLLGARVSLNGATAALEALMREMDPYCQRDLKFYA